MELPDPASMQTWSLVLAAIAAAAALVSILLGLFSLLTGRDHWPKPIRRLRRRTPASEEDHRTHGVSMMLTGGAMMLALLGVTVNAVGAGDRAGEPAGTLSFVITLIAAGACLAGVIGSYSLSIRVRYLDAKTSAGDRVGL